MNKLQELEILETKTNTEPTEKIVIPLLKNKKSKPIEEEPVPVIKPKAKRIPSEKQLKVLEEARNKLKLKTAENKVRKQIEEEEIEKEVQRRFDEYKVGIEAKLIKKAISVKKKQIKREAILDEISDDDTSIKSIKQIAKKAPVQQLPPPPKIEPVPKYIYV